jgi:DNA helicase-2/ATP-dependent DNA helicase PcrA
VGGLLDNQILNLNIEGPMGAGKTSRLIEIATDWLSHLPSQQVLILCSNHTRQKAFQQALLNRLKTPVSHLPVYTYSGWVRNTLFNYWPLVEEKLEEGFASQSLGHAKLIPQLSGLEDSELLLNRLLDEYLKRHPQAFEGYPGNRASLVKQLVRRLRLRSENRLSRQEMTRRSQLLDEMCLQETADIERLFDRMSYAMRVLDPNKQLDVFHGMLKPDAPLLRDFQSQYFYLMVDDVDETTPAQQGFLLAMIPTLKGLVLSADVDGGSRRGYLNAYPYDWEKLKTSRPAETETLTRQDKVFQASSLLLKNWMTPDAVTYLGASVQSRPTMLTQVDMLDQMMLEITETLAQGRHPGELALVFPTNDLLLFSQVQRQLKSRGIPSQVLSGTRRPLDHPLCRGLLYLLQWLNCEKWDVRLSPLEMRTILIQILQIQQFDPPWLDQLLESYSLHGVLPDSITCPPRFAHEGDIRLRHLLSWAETAKKLSFDQQLLSAFKEILTRYVATDADRLIELQQWLDSYLRQREIQEELGPILETLFQGKATDLDQQGTQLALLEDENKEHHVFEQYWMRLVKTGSMADTPDAPTELDPGAIIIGSPQKIIDMEVRRPIQFWMDTRSRQWARSDDAPLYNAWVHSAVWDGETLDFSDAFKEKLIRTRAAHITRTLMLLAQESVTLFASELDAEGSNHYGLLPGCIPPAPALDNTSLPPLQRGVLRADQQPVLTYQTGTMAITAVPGAGKTFINVELILEWIERGFQANQILVLTYMDSAAKTLMSRLKLKLPPSMTLGGKNFPTICTIHSLALRILTENEHCLRLGVDPDEIEILDDLEKSQILGAVAGKTCPAQLQPEGWMRAIDRGIGHAKMLRITPEAIQQVLAKSPQLERLSEFLPAYILYQQTLKQSGKMDFTDLILNAVLLLEQHDDIRLAYQQQFRIIMEDEAQDSSRLLQQLLSLMGGNTPNLIRTGDPNQSITTTFSAADPAVFREFIQQADLTVQMTQSGRCAPEVIQLANAWIDRCEKHSVLRGAFEAVTMMPVVGQNPSLLLPMEAQCFDLDVDENEWLVKTVKDLRERYPEKSLAILVRRNEDALQLTAQLQQNSVAAITLSDTLNQNGVFTVLMAYLSLMEAPGDPKRQETLYLALTDAKLIPYHQTTHARLLEVNPFYSSPHLLEDEVLMQLAYDWREDSREAVGSNLGQLIIRWVERLFHSVQDRSNGYLFALWVQDLVQNQHWTASELTPLELVLRQLATAKTARLRRGFSELLNDSPSAFVQVMSLHKSKGQEFDFVLMPKLVSRYFRSDYTEIRFQEEDKLLVDLGRVQRGGRHQAGIDEAMKRDIMHEEARLMFVGLTRARQGLFLSASKNSTAWGKPKPSPVSFAFQSLSELIQPVKTASESRV